MFSGGKFIEVSNEWGWRALQECFNVTDRELFKEMVVLW